MKKILIFSNGEQIGDGILKLVLIYQLRNRFPEHEIHWATDKNKTVYDTILKSFVSNHIDVIWSQSNLSPFFWNKISCLLYTSPSPRDKRQSRMPSYA